jgi:hypothetical protein
MGPWIFLLLFRVASGDHYRKATPTERRWYGSVFLFFPIFIFSGAGFGYSILDKAGPLGIWGFMMGCALVFAALLFVWTRYIPAIVSAILGAVAWGVTIWLSITGRL